MHSWYWTVQSVGWGEEGVVELDIKGPKMKGLRFYTERDFLG